MLFSAVIAFFEACLSLQCNKCAWAWSSVARAGNVVHYMGWVETGAMDLCSCLQALLHVHEESGLEHMYNELFYIGQLKKNWGRKVCTSSHLYCIHTILNHSQYPLALLWATARGFILLACWRRLFERAAIGQFSNMQQPWTELGLFWEDNNHSIWATYTYIKRESHWIDPCCQGWWLFTHLMLMSS